MDLQDVARAASCKPFLSFYFIVTANTKFGEYINNIMVLGVIAMWYRMHFLDLRVLDDWGEHTHITQLQKQKTLLLTCTYQI